MWKGELAYLDMTLLFPEGMIESHPTYLWHMVLKLKVPLISQKLSLAFQEYLSWIWQHSRLKHHEDQFQSSEELPEKPILLVDYYHTTNSNNIETSNWQ